MSSEAPATATAEPVPCRDHHGVELDAKEGFRVIECEPCGFRHTLPVPSQQELAEVYRHEYYSLEKPLYLERSEEDRSWWEQVFAERLQRFEERGSTGSDGASKKLRVLDVGSGPGLFLDVARSRGWQAVGIEPSRQAAAHARERGHEVVEEFLSEDTLPSLGRFDAVHLNEVLEHLPDPAGCLELCARLLVPGGSLCVAVPNDYNPVQDVLRGTLGFAPWWVAPPHHINYFDFDSLTKLLERKGFGEIEREATFPIELFLLMGENYIGNDAKGRECHQRRKVFEENLHAAGAGELKRALYGKLAELGLGRQAVLFGTLPAE